MMTSEPPKQTPESQKNDSLQLAGARLQASDQEKQENYGQLFIWLERLQKLEFVIGVSYAICLPVSLSVSEVLLYVGLSLCLVRASTRLATKSSPGGQELPAGIAPLTFPLILFAIAVTISGALNSEGQLGLSTHSFAAGWKCLYSLKAVLAYFWAFSIFRRSRSFAVTAVILLLWCSAIAGIWGSIQHIFNIHPGYKWLQGTGFHGHPMAFAGQMQIFSMLSLGLFVASGYKDLVQQCSLRYLKWLMESTQRQEVFSFVVAANFAGLFFAGERSAWLGGFAGVIALTMLKSWRVSLISLLGLSGLSAGALLCFSHLRARVAEMLSGHDKSFDARQRIWNECLHNYFPKDPLFGIGWTNFPHIVMPEMTESGAKDLNHAHSNYVHILTTTGIVGFLSYIILLVWTFKTAISKVRFCLGQNDRFMVGAAMGVFGAAVSLAIAGIFEFNFGTAQVRLAQWFLFGLL